MKENNYGIKDAKNKYIKALYKKYTDHIINFENHIKNIYKDWVIDIDDRNHLLNQLNILVRSIFKIYNTNIRKIYSENKDHYVLDVDNDLHHDVNNDVHINEDIYENNKNNKCDTNINNSATHIYQMYNLIQKNIRNTSDKIKNNLVEEKYSDPFREIMKELIIMCQDNGFISIDSFLKFYIFDNYYDLLDDQTIEILDLYNKVFIPIGIEISDCSSGLSQPNRTRNKYSNKNNNKSISDSVHIHNDNFTALNIYIDKTESIYDSLIDNTCKITIVFYDLSLKIIFDGYICADILNTYVRTSQIYSERLFQIKIGAIDAIKKNYPLIDSEFLKNYSKMINSSCFFVNTSEELANKIVSDYKTFNDLNSKHFNLIMKDFINTNIKTMFSVINLSLMGNKQNVSRGVLLFSLLNDKKLSSGIIKDIIFHNLSYFSQIKLNKTTLEIKNEMVRMKTLTTEDISIEKRLASLFNMPDSVKSYILEKINEINSGESNYKLQMAINGLMQYPWKPKDFKNEFSEIKKSMIKSRSFLQSVAKKLDDSVYGHIESKKVLIELVGKWIQNPNSTGQVIGLVGPPGIGKTLLAKSISSALGIPLSIVGLGGMSDSADLIGHSFTYAGSQYGMIIRQMIKAGNWRCVMFFDEVDKVSKKNDINEIYNTLIHITDPNMNQHFQDRFYSSSIEFDLSGVLIVFSYNDSTKLDPILLDRIKEININPYSTWEKISISQKYIIKELCNNIGFDRNKISIDDCTIRYIIEKYTLEAGVRELQRKLEQVILKLNIDRFYMRGPFKKIIKEKYYELRSIKYKNQSQFQSQIQSQSEYNPTNYYLNSDNNSIQLEYNDNCDLTDFDKNICSNSQYPEPKSEIKQKKISIKKKSLSSYVEHKQNKYEDLLDQETLNKIFNMEFENCINIDSTLINKYLDNPLTISEHIHCVDLVGMINGLYATSNGTGGILSIQTNKKYIGYVTGNEYIKITGKQKQVMRESVNVALTVAISLLNSRIKENISLMFPNGFHVHAPDGATPKDGPSAGCAFATAFVSLILNKKINRYIAMTGEIELTGKISKIGGLDAKLAGAKKAGIRYVYICRENVEDYEKIKDKNPELFTNDFKIKIIDHIIDIILDKNVMYDTNINDFDPDIVDMYRKKSTYS